MNEKNKTHVAYNESKKKVVFSGTHSEVQGYLKTLYLKDNSDESDWMNTFVRKIDDVQQ